MTENLYNALERALKALESDTKPEIRVSECSENEAVLCNLIETAQIARAQITDGEIKAVSQRSRTRVLARAAQLRQFSQHRPSTFNRNPRLAYFLVPDSSRCVQCGICSYYCPIEIDVRRHAWEAKPVKSSHCLTCGECVQRCPRGVLRFERTNLFNGELSS